MPSKNRKIIVGNYEARKRLKKNVLNNVPTLIVGPNGIGKTSSVVELADFLELNLRHLFPLSQEEIVQEFGTGPTDPSNSDMYVIEADGLGAKKYSILKNYIKNIKRPLILIARSKERLNKRIVKQTDVLTFEPPNAEEIEKLLRNEFSWSGNIEDIYDPDMRIVLARVISGEKILKPMETEYISSKDLAVELGYGYVKKQMFDKLNQPLWWVIRWLAFNQKLKFPRSPTIMLKNLSRLSLIDEYKFMGVENYLHYMLMGIRGSPRRAFFKFPIWPKKEEINKAYKILLDAPDRPVKEKFSLNNWL